jgi:hypothetical protein
MSHALTLAPPDSMEPVHDDFESSMLRMPSVSLRRVAWSLSLMMRTARTKVT